MDYCGLGKPIDEARIRKHESLCGFLISRHFAAAYLPKQFTRDDLMNGCRYEVVRALKKLDREKALGSTLKDEVRRRQKLAQKAKDPERALEQAEKNVVYWQIDNYLKRMKWRHGLKTGPKKQQAKHVSYELLCTEFHEHLTTTRPGMDLATEVSHRILAPAVRQSVEALYGQLLWLHRYRGAEAARQFVAAVPENYRESLEDYIELRAEQIANERNNPFDPNQISVTSHKAALRDEQEQA